MLHALQRDKEHLTQFLVHDLRSPLSALTMTLSWMEQEVPGGRGALAESVRTGLAVTARLDRMISDLLDVPRLEQGRPLVNTWRFHELRYEDLIRDPVGEMRRLYEQLELGGFEEFRPRLEQYLATIKGYETNRYQLTPALRAEITRRWGKVIDRYGYARGE